MLQIYRDRSLYAIVETSKVRCPKLSVSGERTSQTMIENYNGVLFDSLIRTLLD